MFEDIIGELRIIEILYADGVWRIGRMKELKPFFTFRYVDDPKIHWRALGEPFKENGIWTVLGEIVED